MNVTSLSDFERRMKLFDAELAAAEAVANQARRLRLTAPVDDDFPSVIHAYEGAVTTLLKAAEERRKKP